MLPAVVFEPANAAQQPLPPGEDPARHTPEFIVDQIAASGAHCVKIFIEDGFGERSDWPMMSTETLKRVRAQTSKHGLLLVAHANAIDMQRIAVDAGVDVLAHGLWNWNEFTTPKGVPEPIAAHLRNVHAKKIGFQPLVRHGEWPVVQARNTQRGGCCARREAHARLDGRGRAGHADGALFI